MSEEKQIVPCADCGSTGGYVPHDCLEPKRTSGAIFGCGGLLCNRCYTRRYKAAKVRKSPAKPKSVALIPNPTPLASISPAKYQPLVLAIAKKYRGRGLGLPDLVAEGQVGLMRAIQTYEPERGWTFGSKAKLCIRKAIRVAIDRQASPARGTDVLEMNGQPSRDLARWEDRHDVAVLMRGLKPDEARVIRMRYDFDGAGELTFREIARQLGCSVAWAYRLEDRAMARLREAAGEPRRASA